MQALAVKAYGEVRNRTADNKSLEHALFDQITDALRDVAVDQEKTDAAKWADAVNRNLELWTILTTDLLHPENKLPDADSKVACWNYPSLSAGTVCKCSQAMRNWRTSSKSMSP